MGVLHFLNVSDGDCTIIEHPSGRVTMLDVNNASIREQEAHRECARTPSYKVVVANVYAS